jgi:hypothetical protein
MALRTTSAAVQGVLIEHYDSVLIPSLAPFIETANSIVNRLVELDTDSILGASTLELIERWLAGHFYAHADQIYQYKQTGNAAATFQGKTGMALTSTQYGQTAILLDSTGELAKLSKETEEGGRRRVDIIWLGTEYE